uniref:GYF domain-containing protein n=1 Tax=Clastoptera arizonana TaxID=38151 RepID=A0A1B6BWU0_9HEMI
MSKRKLEDLNDSEEDEFMLPDSTTSPSKSGNKCKNSLDSDEDDDIEEIHYVLDEDDIEGQEDLATGYDDNVEVTPFNMKEEMKEGYFDGNGMYHWNKEEDGVVVDNWVANLEGMKPYKKPEVNDDRPESPYSLQPFNEIQVYERILPFLKPKETIAKALQRIGSKIISSSERWKRKKAGLIPNEDDEESKTNVIKLTELADSILQQTGNMDIYQETFELISKKVNKAAVKSAKATELDMYSDDFDEKEKEKLENNEENSGPSGADVGTVQNDVLWEFKWFKDSDWISGPHCTEQMSQWAKSNYFNGEVWVRKCGEDIEFTSSLRMDFDIYL